MSKEDEIRLTIKQRIDALERKDAAAAAAMLASDIVAFEMVGPLSLPSGTAADVASIRAWMESWAGPIEVETRDERIFCDGDVAFAFSLHHLSGERVGGARTDLWLRSTLCFQRREGSWQIVHSHSSLPFDPANGFRAQLELKP